MKKVLFMLIAFASLSLFAYTGTPVKLDKEKAFAQAPVVSGPSIDFVYEQEFTVRVTQYHKTSIESTSFVIRQTSSILLSQLFWHRDVGWQIYKKENILTITKSIIRYKKNPIDNFITNDARDIALKSSRQQVIG